MGTGIRRLAGGFVLQHSVGRRMRGIYDPSRDFVIYVGTTIPTNTPDPGHRSRLLSLVPMNLSTEYKTRDLIPPESWAWSQQEHGDRWMYAFAITKAWTCDGFPAAYDYAPRAYRVLGNPANFGGFVQINADEVQAIQDFDLTEVSLKKQAPALKVEARARLSAFIKQTIPSNSSRMNHCDRNHTVVGCLHECGSRRRRA